MKYGPVPRIRKKSAAQHAADFSYPHPGAPQNGKNTRPIDFPDIRYPGKNRYL